MKIYHLRCKIQFGIGDGRLGDILGVRNVMANAGGMGIFAFSIDKLFLPSLGRHPRQGFVHGRADVAQSWFLGDAIES